MASLHLNFDQQQLWERVQEQEDVIRQLWDRYKQDVGHAPELSDRASARSGRYVPISTDAVARALDREKNFGEAVEAFDFQYTYSYTEAATQRVAGKLMHSRKAAVVSRRAGDVVLSGFYDKGVSMPAFEKLLQKMRGLQTGSIRRVDLSDNGMNGNFIPGIREIIRRGVRQLDLSQNKLESQAMQELCSALPQITQFLEVLDLRFNPCQEDAQFVRCLAGILPDLKFLERLSVTIRCAEDEGPAPRYSRPVTPQRSNSLGRATALRPTEIYHSKSDAGQSRGARSTTQPRQYRRSSTPGHVRPQHSELPSGRARASSQSGMSRSRTSPRTDAPPPVSAVDALGPLAVGGVGGRDAGVSFFRAVAENPHIRILDLRSSQLSRPAVQRLAVFVRSDRLIGLSLADCFLSDLAETLLDAVSVCRSLVWLNLRLNAIKGASGMSLCRVLDSSTCLTDVDLASNELRDDFGVEFARILMSNEVLWKVDLVRNPLGLKTGEALLNALLSKNSTLVSIGDTVDNFFALGLQNRFQIQMLLDANRKGLEVGARPADGLLPDVMNPGLADFEWRILDDEPQLFEPLIL